MMPLSPEDAVQVQELSTQYSLSKGAVESLFRIYGSRTIQILEALKTPSTRYFFRVNTLKEDVKGLLERLEAYGLEVEQDPFVPEASSIRVEGPFELPPTSKRIVTDRIAAESVMQGANLYASGVMRCQGVARADFFTIMDDLGHPVAVGRAWMSEREILVLRSGLAVKTVTSNTQVSSLRHLPEYADGLVYVQSFPSMLASRILDPQPGETVIDLCSSPRGKLTHMAQLMKDEGNLLAVDRNPRKIEKIKSNPHRLGIRTVKLLQGDSRIWT